MFLSQSLYRLSQLLDYEHVMDECKLVGTEKILIVHEKRSIPWAYEDSSTLEACVEGGAIGRKRGTTTFRSTCQSWQSLHLQSTFLDRKVSALSDEYQVSSFL